MKKLEIYQVGKVPPVTVVECDKWELSYSGGLRLLQCLKRVVSDTYEPIAIFLLDNIAGFKEV